jgi:glycosyltransferase involved in cell wall biosynthesis
MASDVNELKTASVPTDHHAPATAQPTITLLLPVLNEIDGLKATLPFIDRAWVTEILMVDGGSTDGSVEYARAQGITVVRQPRPGLAWAVYDAVVQLDTDYVIEFSPDGNCPVDVLPELVRKLGEGNDLVVVSRYLPPARSEDDNPLTAFGNWMFTRMFRYLGRFPVTDALTIYRGFRTKIVLSHRFGWYLAGPVFEPLVTGICNLHGMKICEIPGDEPKRVGGVSKMRPFYNGSCILLMVARLYLTKFFGVTI